MEPDYIIAFRLMLDEACLSTDPRVHRLALQLIRLRMQGIIASLTDATPALGGVRVDEPKPAEGKRH